MVSSAARFPSPGGMAPAERTRIQKNNGELDKDDSLENRIPLEPETHVSAPCFWISCEPVDHREAWLAAIPQSVMKETSACVPHRSARCPQVEAVQYCQVSAFGWNELPHLLQDQGDIVLRRISQKVGEYSCCSPLNPYLLLCVQVPSHRSWETLPHWSISPFGKTSLAVSH